MDAELDKFCDYVVANVYKLEISTNLPETLLRFPGGTNKYYMTTKMQYRDLFALSGSPAIMGGDAPSMAGTSLKFSIPIVSVKRFYDSGGSEDLTANFRASRDAGKLIEFESPDSTSVYRYGFNARSSPSSHRLEFTFGDVYVTDEIYYQFFIVDEPVDVYKFSVNYLLDAAWADYNGTMEPYGFSADSISADSTQGNGGIYYKKAVEYAISGGKYFYYFTDAVTTNRLALKTGSDGAYRGSAIPLGNVAGKIISFERGSGCDSLSDNAIPFLDALNIRGASVNSFYDIKGNLAGSFTSQIVGVKMDYDGVSLDSLRGSDPMSLFNPGGAFAGKKVLTCHISPIFALNGSQDFSFLDTENLPKIDRISYTGWVCNYMKDGADKYTCGRNRKPLIAGTDMPDFSVSSLSRDTEFYECYKEDSGGKLAVKKYIEFVPSYIESFSDLDNDSIVSNKKFNIFSGRDVSISGLYSKINFGGSVLGITPLSETVKVTYRDKNNNLLGDYTYTGSEAQTASFITSQDIFKSAFDNNALPKEDPHVNVSVTFTKTGTLPTLDSRSPQTNVSYSYTADIVLNYVTRTWYAVDKGNYLFIKRSMPVTDSLIDSLASSSGCYKPDVGQNNFSSINTKTILASGLAVPDLTRSASRLSSTGRIKKVLTGGGAAGRLNAESLSGINNISNFSALSAQDLNLVSGIVVELEDKSNVVSRDFAASDSTYKSITSSWIPDGYDRDFHNLTLLFTDSVRSAPAG